MKHPIAVAAVLSGCLLTVLVAAEPPAQPKVEQVDIQKLADVQRDIVYATYGDRQLRLDLYLPKNKDFKAPENEKPPLIVRTHGGPTSSSKTSFALDFGAWQL